MAKTITETAGRGRVADALNRRAKTAPHCTIHPKVALICPACRPDLVIDRAAGGRNSRGVSSKAKAKASARNGRLGGRPKLPRHSRSCDVKVTGRYTAGCPRCQYENGKIETAIRAADIEAGTAEPPRQNATK